MKPAEGDPMEKRKKLIEGMGEIISQFKKMAEGKGNIYERCPLVNTKLPKETCRVAKRMMECPTDSFCCKDCPEFGNCDAQCQVATELTKSSRQEGLP